ncbi:MAG: hypothetical protein R3F49_23290 [Planctomycetota bacterium]
MKPLRPRTDTARARLLAATLLCAAASCASVDFTRDTATSGTFRSSARSFTILSWELPRPAEQVAHENASDSGLPLLHVTSERVTHWGWWDWVLEILSSRSATVRGTWGDPGE